MEKQLLEITFKEMILAAMQWRSGSDNAPSLARRVEIIKEELKTYE